MVKIRTVEAKNFMTKTGLGHDFACNPYAGCEHGCLYCYAQTMPLFSNRFETWGTYVDIKSYTNYDIPKNTGSKSLLFSSMTDSYQPTEASVKNTRKVIENIYESNLQVTILTKSALVTRDLDLFRQMKSIEIGFSIATDDRWAKVLEPKASLPSKRIEALKELHDAGIKTYVFISPIIPFITNVASIIKAVKPYADYILFDGLNLSNEDNKKRIFSVINHLLPDRVNDYNQIFVEHNNHFYQSLIKEIESLIVSENIQGQIFF